MKLADVNRAAILAVLPKMGPTFQTKELSEHPDVWRAHPMAGIGNYHAMIGKALAQMSEVEPLDGKGRKGARWKNLRSSSGTSARSEQASQPAASLSVPEPTPATPSAGDLGPQYARDGAFKQRMRLHQSWYRANVLGSLTDAGREQRPSTATC